MWWWLEKKAAALAFFKCFDSFVMQIFSVFLVSHVAYCIVGRSRLFFSLWNHDRAWSKTINWLLALGFLMWGERSSGFNGIAALLFFLVLFLHTLSSSLQLMDPSPFKSHFVLIHPEFLHSFLPACLFIFLDHFLCRPLVICCVRECQNLMFVWDCANLQSWQHQ